MNYNSYNIDLHLDGLSGTFTEPKKILKSSEIEFNFNHILYPDIDLVKMKIQFDGKSKIYEFENIKKTFVLKRESSFLRQKDDIILIDFFFSNFNKKTYRFPIIFALPSILDMFDGAIVKSAQFLDTKENDDLFFVMHNNKKQYFNFRSGNNVISYRRQLLEMGTIPPGPLPPPSPPVPIWPPGTIVTPSTSIPAGPVVHILAGLSATLTGSVTADILTHGSDYLEVDL